MIRKVWWRTTDEQIDLVALIDVHDASPEGTSMRRFSPSAQGEPRLFALGVVLRGNLSPWVDWKRPTPERLQEARKMLLESLKATARLVYDDTYEPSGAALMREWPMGSDVPIAYVGAAASADGYDDDAAIRSMGFVEEPI